MTVSQSFKGVHAKLLGGAIQSAQRRLPPTAGSLGDGFVLTILVNAFRSMNLLSAVYDF